MTLSYKRRAFVEAYLQTWNATKAAERAKYKHPGSQGHRLLQNVEIQEVIAARLSKEAMSADEVLHRLAAMASGDISGFVSKGGAIDWEKVRQQGHLVKKIAHHIGKSSTIELYDAKGALELLGKHHKLFVERRQLEGPDGGEIKVKTIIVREFIDDESN